MALRHPRDLILVAIRDQASHQVVLGCLGCLGVTLARNQGSATMNPPGVAGGGPWYLVLPPGAQVHDERQDVCDRTPAAVSAIAPAPDLTCAAEVMVSSVTLNRRSVSDAIDSPNTVSYTHLTLPTKA